MSYYYKYDFISPEGIFAIVKEEFKSYFDTGAVDDLLFNTYVNKCLNKLGKSSYSISPYVLEIKDFTARLPDNFYAVREAWLCTTIHTQTIQAPNSLYSQGSFTETTQVSPLIKDGCVVQSEEECIDPESLIVYKTNSSTEQSYNKQYLLKPGNISVEKDCTLDCANFGVTTADTFDIRDNKFVTNFRSGHVYLLMYTNESDCEGNQMVPDNFRILEFIEMFLKFKVMETLANQVNDETFNQLQQKMIYYKGEADLAFIMAESETTRETIHTKVNRIAKQATRFSAYRLPTRRRY